MRHVVELALGKRADYCVRAVLHLARHHGSGQRRKARDIAAEMDIPATYLPALMAELVRARIVTSSAGRTGGYALARSPETISLLEVVETADGEIGSTECVLRGGPCRWEGTCAIHDAWSDAQRSLRDSLAGTNFAQLAEVDAELGA